MEWSRIQPAPDKWDEDALDKYRLMLRGLHERGLTAMVTLHHFTDPLWLAERGGWENEEIAKLFEKFVRKTVEAFKEYATLWCTINEPNVYALSGYANGSFPPGVNDIRRAVRVEAAMLRAHAAAYRAIHEIQPEAQGRLCLALSPDGRRATPGLRWMCSCGISATAASTWPSRLRSARVSCDLPLAAYHVPEAKGTQDYFGLNYYSVDTVFFNIRKAAELFTDTGFPKDADLSDNRYIANVPQGFYDSLKWAVRTYPSTPIIVTENGVECADDHMRPRYMAEHIHRMWRAVNFNWPIQGYFHWSLVDNFEWERGWTQRFGLWELDVETQKRTRRPSVGPVCGHL